MALVEFRITLDENGDSSAITTLLNLHFAQEDKAKLVNYQLFDGCYIVKTEQTKFAELITLLARYNLLASIGNIQIVEHSNYVERDVDSGLNPCPFCGSSNLIFVDNGVNDAWHVVCNCGASGQNAKTKGAATTLWNSRAKQ